MNHFEFGFFDELEKIATDRKLVAATKRMIQQEHKGVSSDEAGREATRRVQASQGSVTRIIPPKFDVKTKKFSPIIYETPIKKSIVRPAYPYRPSTPEEAYKHEQRRSRRTPLHEKFRTIAEHNELFNKDLPPGEPPFPWKPYGHEDRGPLYS